uniref:Uncharacterized protein n=1 Tax=Meloidogyne enterolobii TaxID=390850 RepID=A0A6V7VV29_MELEN|nr:unnamed protein product [Meloidogyne enterolobii]
MFFMLNVDKGLLGPVWNGWLVGVQVVRLRHWAEQWPNDDLQLCSSSCALRCQHGWELLGQWMEQCMALVWCSSTWSSTRLHGGTSTTSTFLVSLKSQLKNLKNAKIKNACGALLLSIFCPCPVLSLSVFLFFEFVSRFLLSTQENGCQHTMEDGTICFFGRTKDWKEKGILRERGKADHIFPGLAYSLTFLNLNFLAFCFYRSF